MIKTKTTIETYNALIELLKKESKVYYSRFGDGDFFIMNGRQQRNQEYSKNMENELIESFNIDHLHYIKGAAINYEKEEGMYKGVFEPYGMNDEMVRWLITNPKINVKGNEVYYNAIMPHYLYVFKPELMITFLDNYIRPKRKMFIGSVPKKEIEGMVGSIDYYVEVPNKNAYNTIDMWWNNVLKHIDDVELCLPAAGLTTRVIQKRLWNMNKVLHSIDLGSVVDAFVGIQSRTWIQKEGNRIKLLK